jgi:hypothetical protein
VQKVALVTLNCTHEVPLVSSVILVSLVPWYLAASMVSLGPKVVVGAVFLVPGACGIPDIICPLPAVLASIP